MKLFFLLSIVSKKNTKNKKFVFSGNEDVSDSDIDAEDPEGTREQKKNRYNVCSYI
jgi:hypothetical protein